MKSNMQYYEFAIFALASLTIYPASIKITQ